METIKRYTDLSQSKVLAKILPIESADMFYCYGMDIHTKEWSFDETPTIIDNSNQIDVHADIPCWSLAALLNILPYPTLHQQRDEAWGLDVWVEQVKPYSVNNTICEVDACYEMIIKLHEQKLL